MTRRLSSIIFAICAFWLLTTSGAWAASGTAVLTWIPGNLSLLTKIERGPAATGTFIEIGSANPGITTFTDATVTVPSTVCYRLRHFRNSDSQYSAYTVPVCKDFIEPLPAPSPPTNVTITITIQVP